LLNYFGEHISEDCGNCDNCNTPPKFFDGTILAQKVCSAVYRLSENEPIGMLVDVLRGSKNAQVYDKGYQNIKTYGATKDVPWLDLQQYIIQMINQGILEIRFHEKGRLLLTPLAHKILFEGRKVRLASLQIKEKTVVKERFEIPETFGLFESLKQLRREIAIEENVPAYIVFSDAALKDMEKRLPETEEEFLQVSGVGQAKSEKYGQRFIPVIKEFLVQHENVKLVRKKKGRTQDVTFVMFQEGKTVSEIALERGFTEGTIYTHLIQLHSEGKPVNLNNFINQAEIDSIINAKKSLNHEEKSVKPLFDYLNEEMPYWKIRMGLYLADI